MMNSVLTTVEMPEKSFVRFIALMGQEQIKVIFCIPNGDKNILFDVGFIFNGANIFYTITDKEIPSFISLDVSNFEPQFHKNLSEINNLNTASKIILLPIFIDQYVFDGINVIQMLKQRTNKNA